MPNERVQFNLTERFAAPLPEFYRRRIVFWKDEDREFEKDVDELNLEGVKIIKLTGTNNFAVKKLLLHDDLESDYLVYCPITYTGDEDNWLQDIEYYSETFRADFISMQMDELNIAPSAAMRKTVKLYAKFFDSKERIQKLRRIGRDYQTPLQLHIDIMAVLAGLSEGSAQDVIIAVLAAGFDKETNSVLQSIRKFGSIEAFWQLARKYTGYIEEEDKPLGCFAAHVLLTALSQTMNTSVLKGLERFVSETNKAYCYSIVHEWRSREDNEDLYELCRTVENELQLPTRFDKFEPETLITGDVFPCINESILKQLFAEISDHVVKADLIMKVCENRRTAGWYGRFLDYFDCLFFIGKMQTFYQEHGGGFHIVEPKKIWKLYTSDLYRMDAYYRRFHHAFGNSLKNTNDVLEDGLKHSTEFVETLYQNWFLRELTACWTNASADDLAMLGYVSEIEKQRDFYKRYVAPASSKNTRAFVIISDALRYCKYADMYKDRTDYAGGQDELATITLKYDTSWQQDVDALETRVKGYKAEKDAAEEAERQRIAAENAAKREQSLKDQYSGKLPVEGMPVSCLKYTSLGEPDKRLNCKNFEKLEQNQKYFNVYWYDENGEIIAAGMCAQWKDDSEYMLKSFSQYYPSGSNKGQTFNYGSGSNTSGSIRDDYDNPEDLWEENQDWYEDEDEAWDDWYDD